jgi:hypothetical protein
MKASNPKHGSLYGGTFIKREVYLSPAWKSLSKNGLKAFMAFYDARIMAQPKGKKGDKGGDHVCVNKDNLGVTHGNFERFGIPRGKVSAAISECMAKGFIELRHSGGNQRGDRNIYALSEKWRYWKPGSGPCQVREKREKHGYQGRGLGAVAKWKKPRQNEQAQPDDSGSPQETEDMKVGDIENLEAKVREVINNHSETRRAKKSWSEKILFHLKDQFQKASSHPLENGGQLLVSLQSIYERFLNHPDENIAYIKRLYSENGEKQKHCTRNVALT